MLFPPDRRLGAVDNCSRVLVPEAHAAMERELLLASLAGYAEEARRGEGRLVLVAGEAGIGKSALVEQLERRVYPAPAARPHAPREQFRQPGALREGHHGHQSAVRHEIQVIERGTGPRESMRQPHLRGVLSA